MPEELSPQQKAHKLAELERRRAALIEYKKQYKAAVGGVKLGFVQPGELYLALQHQTPTMGPDGEASTKIPPARPVRIMSTRDIEKTNADLETIIQAGIGRVNAQKGGEAAGFLGTFTQSFFSYLGGIIFSGAPQAGAAGIQKIGELGLRGAAALPGSALKQTTSTATLTQAGVRDMTPQERTREDARAKEQQMLQQLGMPADPTRLQAEFQRRRDAVEVFLGMPEDPIAREIYKKNTPQVAQIGGELAVIFAMNALLPFRGASGKAAHGISDVAGKNVLARIGGKAGLAGAGVGSVTGYSVEALTNPHAETTDKVMSALHGAAAGYMLMTLFKGRPVGLEARQLHQLALKDKFFARFGKGSGSLSALGKSLTFAPRDTLGFMLEAGSVGTVVGVDSALKAGLPMDEAIVNGVKEGALWMSMDIIAGRIGGMHRWTRNLVAVEKNLQATLMELGLGPMAAKAAATGAQVGVNAAVTAPIGATAGYAAAQMAGMDPTLGAIAGAVAGGTAFRFGQRAGSLLPRETWNKIAKGAWHSFEVDEATGLARLIQRDAVERAMYEHAETEAERMIAKRALGPETRSAAIDRQKFAELVIIEQRLQELMPNEVMPKEPKALQEVLQLGRRSMEIREHLNQRAREVLAKAEADMNPAEAFVRGKKASDTQHLIMNAKAQYEGIKSQRWAQVHKARSQRIEKEAAARSATRAAEGMELNERIGEVFDEYMAVARKEVDELTPAQIYREIAVASGDTVENVKRNIPPSQLTDAMEELSYLRATSGHPKEPITKAIIDTAPLGADVRRNLTMYEQMYKEIPELMDSGEIITPQKLRGLFKRMGWKGGAIKKEGAFYRINFPFVGEIVDTIPAALRKAMLYGRHYKPALVLTGLALGAPLANAEGMTLNTGFLPYEDANTKQGSMAWLPSAAGAATLAAVGLTLAKGFPMRVSGLSENLVRLLRRSGDKLGRESAAMLFQDGSAAILRGAKHSVDANMINKAAQGHGAIMMLVHNHPPLSNKDVADVIVDLNTLIFKPVSLATKQARRYAQKGWDIIQSGPSVDDLMASGDLAQSTNRLPIMGVVGPRSRGVSIAFGKPEWMMPRGQGIGERARRQIQAGTLQDRFKLAQRNMGNALIDFIGESQGVSVGQAKVLEKVARNKLIIPVLLAIADELAPGTALRMMQEHLYKPMGVFWFPNASHSAFERLVAAYMNESTRHSLSSIVHAAEPLSREASYTIQKLKEPGIRERLMRDVFGKMTKEPRRLPKVAPAGATKVKRILPDSITPEEVAKPGNSLKDMRRWGEPHGISIGVETKQGVRTFFARIGENEVATATSIRELRQELHVLAQRDFDKDTSLKMFTVTSASMAGGIGAVAGGILGPFLEPLTRDKYDPVNREASILAGAVLGAIVGAIGGAKASGFALNRQATKLLQLMAPPTDDLLKPTAVKSMMGKPSTVRTPKKKGKGFTYKRGKGPSKQQFFLFPVADQVEHLRRRVQAVAETKGQDLAEVRKHYASTLRKYTPTFIPEENYGELQDLVIAGARNIGYGQADADALWMGLLVNMTVPFNVRQGRRAGPNLFSLAQEAPDVFGRAATEGDMDAVRTMVTTARVMSGVDAAIPEGSVIASRANIKQLLTPEAQYWQTLTKLWDSRGKIRAKGDVTLTAHFGPLPPGLRPPEYYHNAAKQLMASKETAEVGKDAYRLYAGMMATTEKIRIETEGARIRLYKIFAGMDSLEERKLVRGILENKEIRTEAMVKNPVLFERAMQFRGLLDEYATHMGMDPGMRIEDYFPWIYSTRTIRDLKMAKVIPSDIVVPMGQGVPEYKVMKQLLSRNRRNPAGEILDDPIEAGMIYLNGAVRKRHLDLLVGQFNNEWFEQFARTQPFLATDMAKWVLDVFGMPTHQQVRAAARMQNLGLVVEKYAAAFGLNNSELVNEMIDRYFLGPGAAMRFSKFIRGVEFYTKLGGSFISSMVNLSQLPANTGTDLGMASIFIGGIPFAAHAGLGAIGQKIPRLAGFIDPKLAGLKKLRLAQSIGVWTDNTKRVLDQFEELQAREAGRSLGTVFGAMTVGGIGGALLVGEDTADAIPVLSDKKRGRQRQITGVAGAALAGAAAIARPSLIRRALQRTKATIILPFSVAEAVNRGVTAGAARFEARAARAAMRSPSAQRAAQVGEVIEHAGIGAATGAGIGGTMAEPGDRMEGAKTGAIIGGVAGGAMGVASRRRYARVAQELDMIEDNAKALPGFRKQLQGSLDSITEADIEKWYMRQVLDQTQFRFGREGRSQILRTQTGEILGALQSFTLNQVEFTGERYRAFIRSVAAAHGKSQGALKTAWKGEYDLRVFRHLALVAASGSALAALSAGMDSDKGTYYWTSRIGFGLLPVIHWNEDAESWQLSDIGQHLTGPFISDVQNALRTITRLATDPVASQKWDEQADNLARQVIAALRQMESGPEALAAGFDKLGAEGLKELAESQQELGAAVGRPVSTIRHGDPKGGRGGGTSGTGAFGSPQRGGSFGSGGR